MTDRLFTRKELKKYFNVSICTIDNWLREGKLKYFKINNTVRISQNDLNEFLLNNK